MQKTNEKEIIKKLKEVNDALEVLQTSRIHTSTNIMLTDNYRLHISWDPSLVKFYFYVMPGGKERYSGKHCFSTYCKKADKEGIDLTVRCIVNRYLKGSGTL